MSKYLRLRLLPLSPPSRRRARNPLNPPRTIRRPKTAKLCGCAALHQAGRWQETPLNPPRHVRPSKDSKPAAAAPAPTKPEEGKKTIEPAKVDEVKKPVGQETPTASATRTADGPKGSAVTKVFEDRLDAPTEADLFKLPTPSEGEIYSMAVHPAYLKDFLGSPRSR